LCEVDRDSDPLAAVQKRKRQIHVPMFLLESRRQCVT
jgi:hypothetical protein